MVAPRRAARDLQIDEAVADPVAGDDLAQDAPQRLLADRRGDAQRRQRRLQPREMARLVDQRAVAHQADFIDAVAEDEGAIQDRHACLGERQVAAIDVGDAAHLGFPFA